MLLLWEKLPKENDAFVCDKSLNQDKKGKGFLSKFPLAQFAVSESNLWTFDPLDCDAWRMHDEIDAKVLAVI